MKYLFTYRNGKKALGLTSTNRGLAFRVGSTTVFPLLVSTSAENASCVRMKVNNEIKSIAYVPSLVIPGVLCAKEGTAYINPTGVSFNNAFYRECFYDRYYGHYLAFSDYTAAGGNNTKAIAISLDGHKWTEIAAAGTSVGHTHKWAIVNTKRGVITFNPVLFTDGQGNVGVNITGTVWYKTENGIQYQDLYTWNIWPLRGYDFTRIELSAATDGENGVAVYYWIEYKNGGYHYYDHGFYHVNLNTNAITPIDFYYGDPASERISALWYNKILNRYFYRQGGCYYSNDGLNFTYMEGGEQAPVSYGNLNGLEVFDNGLSADGVNVTQGFNYRPNAYDPIEKKYIRIVTSWVGTGQGSEKYFYVDVYESTDLYNWTFVLTRNTPTVIYPQALTTVNTDGFACVKGF